MPNALVFMAATQGTWLDHLALVASEACVPGPMGLEQIKRQFLPATTPRALCKQQNEAHPRLSVKKVYLLILELCPVGQASGLARSLLRCSLCRDGDP